MTQNVGLKFNFSFRQKLLFLWCAVFKNEKFFLAHFIPAALLFVAGYAGCQALGAAWLGIAALLVSGTAPAGALAAIADLAPAESPACAAAACALCSTLGAAGLLAANYFVTQALHGSVSWNNHSLNNFHQFATFKKIIYQKFIK